MSQIINYTLNNVIQEFNELITANNFVKSFYYGDFLEVLSKVKINHTSVLMNTADGSIDENYVSFRLELACFDKVYNDLSNKVDVESETNQILQDIFNVITYSNRWQSFCKISQPAPTRKFLSKGEDVVTGWSMTLTINVKRKSGLCSLPLDDDYDLETSDKPYCAGVRIYQDGILIDVITSGGRYDYESGGGAINIQINDVDAYLNQSTSVNIPVVDSDDNAKGTWDDLNKKQIIGNSQINVNGDAFESISPESNLNVPILDTAGNPTGTNIGASVEIDDSDIQVNSTLLEPIRSQQSKNVLILDDVDSDPVSINLITNTESLAEITVPSGTVNILDNLGNVLSSVSVKSGGTKTKNLSDFSTKKVYYNRPFIPNTISYLTYDEGHQYANNYDPYFVPTDGVLQQIDYSVNRDYLVYFNAFGHNFRFTGLNGGYYNFNDSTYRDVNGNISTWEAEFRDPVGVVSGSNDGYAIDHLTGLGWRTERGGATAWNSAVGNVAGATVFTWNDWRLPCIEWIMTLAKYSALYPMFVGYREPFRWSQATILSSTTNQISTASAFYVTNGHLVTNSTKTVANANQTFCRKHYARTAYVIQP